MNKDASQGSDSYVYTPRLEAEATQVLRAASDRKLRIATAESCTGGALAALLTDVENLSHVFDRGFVCYSNAAKKDCLGIGLDLIKRHGAVSDAITMQMALGTLERSQADIAVAITGNAGPAGPDDEQGLVFICVAVRNSVSACHDFHFGALARSHVRMKALHEALDLLGWATRLKRAM